MVCFEGDISGVTAPMSAPQLRAVQVADDTRSLRPEIYVSAILFEVVSLGGTAAIRTCCVAARIGARFLLRRCASARVGDGNYKDCPVTAVLRLQDPNSQGRRSDVSELFAPHA
jgi:hypothetical protein